MPLRRGSQRDATGAHAGMLALSNSGAERLVIRPRDTRRGAGSGHRRPPPRQPSSSDALHVGEQERTVLLSTFFAPVASCRAAGTLATTISDARFVVDHGGGPDPAHPRHDAWSAHMRDLAAL